MIAIIVITGATFFKKVKGLNFSIKSTLELSRFGSLFKDIKSSISDLVNDFKNKRKANKERENIRRKFRQTATDFVIHTTYYYVNPRNINKLVNRGIRQLKKRFSGFSDEMDILIDRLND